MIHFVKPVFVALHLFLVCLLGGTVLAAPGADFDKNVEEARERWGVPGLFVSIVKDDDIVRARGYGVRKAGEPDKVDENTLFSIGSTSKAFAAAAVAVLVDDGAIGWDDTVRQYMPWFELYDPEVQEQFTVRDMLSGTLGVNYVEENLLRPSSADSRDILDKAKAIAPSAPYRSGFVYSNNMFIASGLLVEEVSGKSWYVFADLPCRLRRRIESGAAEGAADRLRREAN
ncbi:MAG: serine hydrolase domain-containing protein, partial [Pseudomonadota bacterium]